MTPLRNERVRIRFDKYGRVRFTSHLDVARIWERVLRRHRIPVAYSEGFSPRPRLRFGLALATSHESDGEYLDIDLPHGTLAGDGADFDLDGLAALVGPSLPPGMTVQATDVVEPGTPSLQEAVTSCDWLLDVPGLTSQAQAIELIAKVLDADELPVARTRKGKDVVDDVRPAVLALRVADPSEIPTGTDLVPRGVLLRAELATQPRAARTSDVLTAMDAGLEEGRVVRLHQWTTVDGVRREPVPLAIPGAAPEGATGDDGIARPATTHAEVRAS